MLSTITIIIPAYNEEKYMAQCLDSIINSTYPKDKIEVFVVDGCSSDNTQYIVQEYSKTHQYIKLLVNTEKITPIAMNIGIVASHGEYIFILSAHAKYSTDYFTKLVTSIITLDADCVGPRLRTDVINRTAVSNAIKNVFSDKLGVGNSYFRTGSDAIKEVDTVSFACYNRKIFDKIGFFNEKLIRAQDLELNKRIKKHGGRIYLIPDVEATYYARENFHSLFINRFNTGKWVVLTAYFTQSLHSISWRHTIPFFFVLSLLLPLLLSIVNIRFVMITALIFSIYLTTVSLRSLKVKEGTSFTTQLVAFLTLHFSYGLGEIVGVVEVLQISLIKIFQRFLSFN